MCLDLRQPRFTALIFPSAKSIQNLFVVFPCSAEESTMKWIRFSNCLSLDSRGRDFALLGPEFWFSSMCAPQNVWFLFLMFLEQR
jgi:hypothetical protein